MPKKQMLFAFKWNIKHNKDTKYSEDTVSK